MPDLVRPRGTAAKPNIAKADVLSWWEGANGFLKMFNFEIEGRLYVAIDEKSALKLGEMIQTLYALSESATLANRLENDMLRDAEIAQIGRSIHLGRGVTPTGSSIWQYRTIAGRWIGNERRLSG